MLASQLVNAKEVNSKIKIALCKISVQNILDDVVVYSYFAIDVPGVQKHLVTNSAQGSRNVSFALVYVLPDLLVPGHPTPLHSSQSVAHY